MRMADKRSGTGRSAVMAMGQVVGLSCRWLDGTVRQQCVGHLPFARRATVNGGFSVRRTGSIDPKRLYVASSSQRPVSECFSHSARPLRRRPSIGEAVQPQRTERLQCALVLLSIPLCFRALTCLAAELQSLDPELPLLVLNAYYFAALLIASPSWRPRQPIRNWQSGFGDSSSDQPLPQLDHC